jgi:hypothetical protein
LRILGSRATARDLFLVPALLSALWKRRAKPITKDQERFRENIEALAKTPEAKQLIERYIAKANEQESRLEEITKSRQTMADEKDKLERELAIEIKNFEIK